MSFEAFSGHCPTISGRCLGGPHCGLGDPSLPKHVSCRSGKRVRSLKICSETSKTASGQEGRHLHISATCAKCRNTRRLHATELGSFRQGGPDFSFSPKRRSLPVQCGAEGVDDGHIGWFESSVDAGVGSEPRSMHRNVSTQGPP